VEEFFYKVSGWIDYTNSTSLRDVAKNHVLEKRSIFNYSSRYLLPSE
jgi:hypothetical protein